MIRIGALSGHEEPVIVSLTKALGDAIDRRQVLIVREYLACPGEPSATTSTRIVALREAEGRRCPACGKGAHR
jgi:hypothetical protein